MHKSFSRILKESRKRARLSQGELAEALGVTRNTILNWESDRSKPDYSCIPALCAALDIPLQDLFDMDSSGGLTAQEERLLSGFRRLSPANRSVCEKIVGVMADEEFFARQNRLRESAVFTVIRPAAVSAGPGVEVADAIPGYTFLRKNRMTARADGIVRVSGDSMEPVYRDGDYVCYKNAEDARPGSDVIVDTDDGAVIKRVAADRTLYSVNPDRPYGEKSEDNWLKIRGVVLGVVDEADRLSEEDLALAEEIFEDEVRAFREKYDPDAVD
jgi:DNA-binding XRE family transcriptional regulator